MIISFDTFSYFGGSESQATGRWSQDCTNRVSNKTVEGAAIGYVCSLIAGMITLGIIPVFLGDASRLVRRAHRCCSRIRLPGRYQAAWRSAGCVSGHGRTRLFQSKTFLMSSVPTVVSVTGSTRGLPSSRR